MLKMLKRWVRKIKQWLFGKPLPDKLDAPDEKPYQPIETSEIHVDDEVFSLVMITEKVVKKMCIEINTLGWSNTSRGLRLRLISVRNRMLLISNVDVLTRRSIQRTYEDLKELLVFVKEEQIPFDRQEFHNTAAILLHCYESLMRNRKLPL